MKICKECDGNGLIPSNFFPNPKQPNVRRTEMIRCPNCLGMGEVNASSET